jgi:hypothetical protein
VVPTLPRPLWEAVSCLVADLRVRNRVAVQPVGYFRVTFDFALQQYLGKPILVPTPLDRVAVKEIWIFPGPVGLRA